MCIVYLLAVLETIIAFRNEFKHTIKNVSLINPRNSYKI